jgi:hypothetical protein
MCTLAPSVTSGLWHPSCGSWGVLIEPRAPKPLVRSYSVAPVRSGPTHLRTRIGTASPHGTQLLGKQIRLSPSTRVPSAKPIMAIKTMGAA